jgi:NADH:ubiquinone oxidoreductase subunit E
LETQQLVKKPIKALQEAQTRDGYLSIESMQTIAKNLEIPVSQIYGIATFYHQFRLKPVGEYVIYICKGTACHTKAKETLIQYLRETLGLKAEETTTEDGLFSIEYARCFGCCSLAPVIMISDRQGYQSRIFGTLTPRRMRSILDEYGEEHMAQRPGVL